MLIPLRQPGSVTLRGLIPSASFVGCAEITVSSVASHSDECTPGCLYVTLPGHRTHGKNFIPQALQRGAAAILTDYPLADVSLPQCIVSDVPKAYGQICHGMYGHPSRKMGIAGVTGTNGKTTTTWILRSLLENASRPTGLIGTVEYSDGVQSEPSVLTTPDAMTLARHLAAMRDRETNYAAIELSSHALDQSRPAGIGLDVAIVSNITHDHLDYHQDIESYIAAKSKIVEYIKPGGALILNSDDEHWEKLVPESDRKIGTLTYGFGDEADITGEIVELTATGSRFFIHYGVERMLIDTTLIGRHNVMNCLAATCGAIHLGLTTEEICEGLAACEPAPGRMEAVNCGQDFQVFVDYAHTDDAIKHVIATSRSFTSGKTILVFGAGGDRDKSKRIPMGEAASEADVVVLTSDNPRSESPQSIIKEIHEGFSNRSVEPIIEIDRQVAITKAIQLAAPGDTVLVVGKGHEKYQMIGGQKLTFDDVAVCKNAIWQAMTSKKDHTHLPARVAG
ncbi:UDP-N-acetylmuramoyl-L-alanyl-D-glutamate--2,6-diaminopimelate ligase [Planctomicrobium sp.]|nr:UDP-N-acetylmuramoyl-L-alanyl-D-glutamate--2,6-diaminopimelate ligase [Planctomicrobium sp.]MDB4732809.1 UDP-N-acetylmuramoyl-L-alanyl-D-glutamate--2,6-diaminopimelate ligase [Planctomicrobium sp.]